MKILFYDTKSYDRESFTKQAVNYPDIEIDFLKGSWPPLLRYGKGIRCRMRLCKLQRMREDHQDAERRRRKAGSHALCRI